MMGKSRKLSKGHAFGFVPDYRHAVETNSESEGYGSSGRVDTEITVSEVSCAPRNKAINMGSDSNQQFGVPIQVISLSKLSTFERKELESRLRWELEQVRTFQKYLEECKKRVLQGSNGNGKSWSHLKNAKFPPATGNAMLMKQCETILTRLMGHNFSWVFNTPVDVVALKIPDYYTVIKHPMDLGTVKLKLNSGKYVDPWGFAADVRLTFSNAMTYNPRGNDVHNMAETLSKFFEVRWKPIEKKLVPLRQTDIENGNFTHPLKKKKTLSFGNEIKEETSKEIMSVAEKQKLSSELEASLADLPETIVDFLKENSSNANATVDDEIEIDIDTLSDGTLFKLRKLLDNFLVDKQKNMIHGDTGFTNSSLQAVKVNDVNEDDVDIGGNSKCSSSSSSSSDSGSSSSESDRDSNGVKLSAIVNNIKDTLGSEVNIEQMINVPDDAEDSVNRMGQVEQKSQSIPVSAEVNGNQEGECALNERQVSPDKLYRAALLRNRFADTILKAQEKTNGKVENQDRERLRLDKEEIERRKKEEKGRLQVEARAAEEAKRNAELEAAAEAKRKRELEREAARQAIQKMEKIVDINNNSRFLEDLEMLSVGSTEPLESLINENSADCYQDPLGRFNFNRTRNPLEQLGLYRKDDDDNQEVDID